ncbi:aminomethyl-transferring glycine dehydrogenase [Cytophaga hutchinsonii]|uniref:Glycine dehydrogenase (decarboxylating) n=1 Tax=Cytophaga hutchinsonii (strain ATCC 33406 / DSM 1761 / CIP 103989 / NBRC 15051 / NCIMB 9469 / D465) TaxID=269798 RepID=A0A6N4SPT4_CYTH3|nr:aminomethyl-transferring glycine dehydrogenase [Cytophaga hutchinsonii]ABG58298.1 glycine dehydrogenase (decarboxylating) alpha subunit / glycine dehydrogenase (decarboxylating) beta subunit [Cytophaga hutchinsonii ATCC 33406]SFX53070.1 glycine dehydrogenase (decarboxylating) alpha subunit /glycine dehydrogenase (decarboxylating) beta subunit [Cytophaga hutchinsonii ATCC 33406]
MKIDLTQRGSFQERHIGTSLSEKETMLKAIGVGSLDQLIDETVPANIRLANPLQLPKALSEEEFLVEFKKVVSQNEIFKTYIGLGYYNTLTPTVILRNILENPGWYTAYTPYQAEIAQGRLEALINYQTMVCELTGMEIANASLLDEATAAAEAMTLIYSLRKGTKKNATVFVVSKYTFPQTIDVLLTRSEPLGIKLEMVDPATADFTRTDIFGALVQSPDCNGNVADYTALISAAHANDTLVAFGSDLLSLTLIKSPGEMGADVVFGSSQRFGVPMGFGGPHAGFFATKEEYKRQLPGRIIGVSIDAEGKKAYRMSLQTREQHIRREKATSNICTAQVLLSVIAASYAVYHGPEGLKQIANRVHGFAAALSAIVTEFGFEQTNAAFFDTISIKAPGKGLAIKSAAEKRKINLRYEGDSVFVALDESVTVADLDQLIEVFAEAADKKVVAIDISNKYLRVEGALSGALLRTSAYMTHPVFNTYHTEHEMLRYLKHLENKDLSLTHSMISLGSCTMKLNATTEMIPVTWPEVGQIHPFVPASQVKGYHQLFNNIELWLSEITGFAGVSVQPNSGAQGEYAGLLVIRAYHESRGDTHRNIALIPTSAHGTNPASAVMAAMQVVLVKCDDAGNIDVADLKLKAEQHSKNLSCLMVTYPSTHGVFEESIIEICEVIHRHGGQVYMDGANMNAQVGLTSPGSIGADVCHLNLHKTFCIPHGGGGPGVGPIGVAAHLTPFLPGHAVVKAGGEKAISAVSAAPWGSASILPISYAYIAMMGSEGLTNATKNAILNANYIKSRLEKFYPILYTGTHGHCAHEFILDCRAFKTTIGIEVEDIAKRLMDYGFHAPTVSFPVAGTLMIEPTESESKHELDRFCDAMIAIRAEIAEIENGTADKLDNVLKHAPHTASVITADAWTRSYSRQKAAYPLPYLKTTKFWPSVSRIDSAYGDRNLFCSCIPTEEFAEAELAN